MFIIKAAFSVYSSLPAIYSLVPSIGSINQNILAVFFILVRNALRKKLDILVEEEKRKLDNLD